MTSPPARRALLVVLAVICAACTTSPNSHDPAGAGAGADATVTGTTPAGVVPVDADVTSIDELISSGSLLPELEAFLASAVATVDGHGETQPGSYEPLIAVDYDTAVSAGSLFANAPDGVLAGRLLVANPANRAFRASLLCLHDDTQVPCFVTQPSSALTVFVDLDPGEAVVVPVTVDDVAAGQDVVVVALIHDDRVDPLPASVAAVTVIVDDAPSTTGQVPGSSRQFVAANGQPPRDGCSDMVIFVSDPPDDRGRVVRGSDVDVIFESCERRRVVPLVFVDRARLVAAVAPPIGAGPGVHRFRLPPHVTDRPVASVQAGALVFDGSGPAMSVSVWFAEEILVED